MNNCPQGRYETSYEIGQDNVEIWGMDLHNPVFFISTTLMLIFVATSIIAPDTANEFLSAAKSWTINQFDWLFMSTASVLIIFCIALIILPVGKIRLGGNEANPEFSKLSWFAMLFAAGMGIGLLFWGVTEPLAYYTGWGGTPLAVEARSGEAAQLALPATIYHWGLHAWAIYAVVGLSLAFFAFNKGLPLTIRSVFYPLLKDRVWGWWGHIIDITAVLATIFGLATSLGFGATQAATGLNFLFDLPNDLTMRVAVIVGVTFFAVLSVVRGIDKGVKILSNINMVLAVLLLLGIFLLGASGNVLASVFSSIKNYFVHIVPLSYWSDRPDHEWMQSWTVFYWAWWISWSPFVGMFIARISKGRTIAEFLIAVLIVPTLVTLIWMNVFGANALLQAQQGIGSLANGIDDASLTLFQMLENIPLTELTSAVAIVLVLLFFITSSDSGSLVIDSITAGGKLDAPIPQRVFWAVTEGAIAAALLIGGGAQALGALQAGTIATGLPFTIVLLVMCLSLTIGLYDEQKSR